MVHIVLATHGEFASGLANAASMIVGEIDDLTVVGFLPSEGPDDLAAHLNDGVTAAGEGGEVLFLVDLLGGSPFNQANKIVAEHPDTMAVVTGASLPMLIDALQRRAKVTSAGELATKLVASSRKAVQVRPKSLDPKELTPKTSSPASVSGAAGVAKEGVAKETAPAGAGLPEGTKLGDGKIEYVLARIDSRLLHGQVAVGWSKATNPTRIIVVSDKVARDDMRKTLISQAAPDGMRANTIPISKLVEIDKDPRFGATRALLLFETPQDVLAAIKAGVKLDTINLGSMAHSTGKVMLNQSVSVDADDVAVLRELQDLGVTFDVRKVPADRGEDLNKLLSAKGF